MTRQDLLKVASNKSLTVNNDCTSSKCQDSMARINAALATVKLQNSRLNEEQRRCVGAVLALADGGTQKQLGGGSHLTLPFIIHGPPGTGKTVTLVETCLQVLSQRTSHRVLIVTPSNSAADLLGLRLLEAGLPPALLVRLNSYQRGITPPQLRDVTITADEIKHHTHYSVLITTASTAGQLHHHHTQHHHFSHLLVDEAGQLTEPEACVVYSVVPPDVITVLCGDSSQLGPVVMSRLAHPLQQSLLHRLSSCPLYESARDPLLMCSLIRNYRSHPSVLHTFSTLFYHSTLLALKTSQASESLSVWLRQQQVAVPVVFHGVMGENLRDEDSPSWYNTAEAYQCVRYTQSLVRHGVQAKDIGIITPYRKQVQKIKALLDKLSLADEVTVGSVEQFQGQERTAVILSAVRSAQEYLESDVKHSLGFVLNPERLNVSLSRATDLLIVVANPILLPRVDHNWRYLLSYCVSHDTYRGCDLQA